MRACRSTRSTRAALRAAAAAYMLLLSGASSCGLRGIRRGCRLHSAAASSGPLDYSVVAVPRTTSDGPWREADQLLVESAQELPKRESEAAAPLLGQTEAQLVSLALADGQPAFRGRQLYEALYGRAGAAARSLADCHTLPAAWRSSLTARGVRLGRSTLHAKSESKDGTTKLLLRLGDGRVVETVGIPQDEATKPRLTVCVSSQVGCPMRCVFCATGAGGFARNLLPSEIVDQVLSVQEAFGRRASHVVFMGMGEPLLNIKHVLASQRCLQADVGISARSMVISSVGVPNTLAMLAREELQCTLAISLHAPTQQLREKIIPSAKAYPLDVLMDDCAAYQKQTGRRVSFEYTVRTPRCLAAALHTAASEPVRRVPRHSSWTA
jgi:23S rRNA (adenine2503-C2)-methyltransferase